MRLSTFSDLYWLFEIPLLWHVQVFLTIKLSFSSCKSILHTLVSFVCYMYLLHSVTCPFTLMMPFDEHKFLVMCSCWINTSFMGSAFSTQIEKYFLRLCYSLSFLTVALFCSHSLIYPNFFLCYEIGNEFNFSHRYT